MSDKQDIEERAFFIEEFESLLISEFEKLLTKRQTIQYVTITPTLFKEMVSNSKKELFKKWSEALKVESGTAGQVRKI